MGGGIGILEIILLFPWKSLKTLKQQFGRNNQVDNRQGRTEKGKRKDKNCRRLAEKEGYASSNILPFFSVFLNFSKVMRANRKEKAKVNATQ